MEARRQRTIERACDVSGVGFLTGADVLLRFLPAGSNHGVWFRRVDRPGSEPIPAVVESTVPRQRRTAIERGGVAVEMVEHVMAALAGLQIDNCVVELNAPEPPGLDGSCRAFVDALLEAGTVELDSPRQVLTVRQPVTAAEAESEIRAVPTTPPGLQITYELDYGPRSPIHPQEVSIEITPESFEKQIAFARTFVLEAEAQALRAEGYGQRTTARDLLIFGSNGPIDNQLHCADECARHKLLDCVGDLALIGCDVHGHLQAYRSGHRLNGEIVRRLKKTQFNNAEATESRAA